jgi:hypothetical protein
MNVKRRAILITATVFLTSWMMFRINLIRNMVWVNSMLIADHIHSHDSGHTIGYLLIAIGVFVQWLILWKIVQSFYRLAVKR